VKIFIFSLYVAETHETHQPTVLFKRTKHHKGTMLEVFSFLNRRTMKVKAITVEDALTFDYGH
jgi:hypothetical protein